MIGAKLAKYRAVGVITLRHQLAYMTDFCCGRYSCFLYCSSSFSFGAQPMRERANRSSPGSP
ncbi:hypothetical protein PACILC2_27410 [Paenibacillus cisolokensis]|uniref:Uncharacterized protein n=1 Tax=Paenibacillus cisolokensis TaxID=1658519 RepID=A0ABQ4N896_9BACL|nr:hypothetical protein [Paenibacillus cisolokensis]GIQ64173.1 hypothetical protein PACILC2_27410 [Paenibacillus cisolokensis]